MARTPRHVLPDGYFHVYARGIAESTVFVDDVDRFAFVDLVDHCARRHGWTCHAFTVLSTHYHLVLEATQESLSAGLHLLNLRYARHVNSRHHRFGHVFAERFSARVIHDEVHLVDVCEYVLLNPVKAGLCERVEDWPWSYSRFCV